MSRTELRDTLAAAALQGLLAAETDDDCYGNIGGERYKRAAIEAYRHADAMLEIRDQTAKVHR